MNQTQIKAVTKMLNAKVTEPIKKKDGEDKRNAIKRREKSLEKVNAMYKRLQDEIKAFNQVEKRSAGGSYYTELSVYPPNKSIKGLCSKGSRWGREDDYFELSTCNMKKLDQSQGKVERFVLELQLGEATLKDVDDFLSSLISK